MERNKMLEPKEQAKLLAAQGGVLTIEAVADSANIQLWLNNSGGYIALNWSNTGAVGKYDYVALFDSAPTDALGYLTYQWQWITSQKSPYVTGTKALGKPYWLAYCGWDYASSKYKIDAVEGPQNP
jgi:hypothetical protein